MNINMNLYKDIDVENNKIFFSEKNSKINIENGLFVSSLENNKKEYISIFEDSVSFNNPGSKLIEVDNKNIYEIEILGVSKNVQVELFIISYSSISKLELESLALNNRICIEPHKDIESIRLALRVVGPGEFKINEIKIYKQKKIEFMSYKDINLLGLDKVDEIKDLRVACIFDDFTMNCYKDMVQLIEITPNNWKVEVSIKKPHILIVESAWSGNSGVWNRKISARDESKLRILKELTDWCKENIIPTIFWNKEDPVHFDSFIKACSYFEYIFTTDDGVVEKYKKILKHNNVYSLPFAAQPKIHNPIKIYENRINKACFAGTYYEGKFKERQEDLNRLLRVSINTVGLDIYDRQYFNESTIYRFPKEYREYIKGGLKYDELDLINKGYKISLNVNSVKNSNTMFSRRVFENLASLTPVVSSYSPGIKNIFGELVTSSDNILELEEEIKKLEDEEYYNKKAILGMRLCMENHTYNSRLKYILDKIGLNVNFKEVGVSLVSYIYKQEDIDKAINTFYRQIYSDKNLVLIYMDESVYKKRYINEDKYNVNIINHVLYEEKIIIKDLIEKQYIGIINTDNYYGKYYINDLVNATKYTDADFIGKKSYFKYKKARVFYLNDKFLEIENNGVNFEYVDCLDLDKCIFNKEVVSKYTLNMLNIYIKNNNLNLHKFGYRYFSIDKYNLLEGIDTISKEYENIIEI